MEEERETAETTQPGGNATGVLLIPDQAPSMIPSADAGAKEPSMKHADHEPEVAADEPLAKMAKPGAPAEEEMAPAAPEEEEAPAEPAAGGDIETAEAAEETAEAEAAVEQEGSSVPTPVVGPNSSVAASAKASLLASITAATGAVLVPCGQAARDEFEELQEAARANEAADGIPSALSSPVLTIKLALLGDGGVGKTTFVQRFRTSDFERRYRPTPCTEVSPLPFLTNRGRVVFNVWDTSGRVGYRCPAAKPMQTAVACADAQAAIIMFDVTSRITYLNVPSWHRDLCAMAPGVSAIGSTVLVGNKVDVRERRVMAKQITFHRKKNLQYYDISAKSYFNFEKPFLWIVRKLVGDPNLTFLAESPALEAYQAQKLKEARAHNIAVFWALKLKVLRERATQRIYSRDAPWQADFQAKRAAELAEFHETPPSAIRL